MINRNFKNSLLVILAAAFTCFVNLQAQPANIIWIMVEDISPELSCYGHPAVKTPNIDGLAEDGVLYQKAYTTAPSCTPSRNAMLLGVFQTKTDTQDQRIRDKELPEGIVPFTKLLQEAGYYTALGCGYAGKTDHNFNYETLPGKSKDYLFDGRDWKERKDGQPFFAQITLNKSHRLGGENKDWIKVSRESLHPVSPEEVVLPPYFPDHPVCRLDWARYLDAIEYVDGQVGEIVTRLKEEGIFENTLIIFIGDNGRCHLRGKCWLYEGGIHVPMIIRYPKLFEANTESNELISTIDITATILDFAGAEMPDYLDGISIVDKNRDEREYVFAARDLVGEVMDHIRCVRTKDLKYIMNFTPENGYYECRYVQDNRPMLQVMEDLHQEGKLNDAQQLLLARYKPKEELYDLRNDPHEINNLAEHPDYADKKAELRNILMDWLIESSDTGLKGHLPWQSAKTKHIKN